MTQPGAARLAVLKTYEVDADTRISLYLATFSGGAHILARLAFPFPHRVHTDQACYYQETNDREFHTEYNPRSGFQFMSALRSSLLKEVATIRYVQIHTKISVARIHAHDVSLTNLVGSPYTLQEVVSRYSMQSIALAQLQLVQQVSKVMPWPIVGTI
jgi:hypothetical protein